MTDGGQPELRHGHARHPPLQRVVPRGETAHEAHLQHTQRLLLQVLCVCGYVEGCVGV
jgi:hypothetical protein